MEPHSPFGLCVQYSSMFYTLRRIEDIVGWLACWLVWVVGWLVFVTLKMSQVEIDAYVDAETEAEN